MTNYLSTAFKNNNVIFQEPKEDGWDTIENNWQQAHLKKCTNKFDGSSHEAGQVHTLSESITNVNGLRWAPKNTNPQSCGKTLDISS